MRERQRVHGRLIAMPDVFSSISLKSPIICVLLGLKNINHAGIHLHFSANVTLGTTVNYGGHRLIRMSNILLQVYSFGKKKTIALLLASNLQQYNLL